MDNAQKAIMIGVGLFITIIIISVVLLITNLGTGLADTATGNLTAVGSSLQSQLTAKYEGKEMSGEEINATFSVWESQGLVIVDVSATNATKVIPSTTKYYYEDYDKDLKADGPKGEVTNVSTATLKASNYSGTGEYVTSLLKDTAGSVYGIVVKVKPTT